MLWCCLYGGWRWEGALQSTLESSQQTPLTASTDPLEQPLAGQDAFFLEQTKKKGVKVRLWQQGILGAGRRRIGWWELCWGLEASVSACGQDTHAGASPGVVPPEESTEWRWRQQQEGLGDEQVFTGERPVQTGSTWVGGWPSSAQMGGKTEGSPGRGQESKGGGVGQAGEEAGLVGRGTTQGLGFYFGFI